MKQTELEQLDYRREMQLMLDIAESESESDLSRTDYVQPHVQIYDQTKDQENTLKLEDASNTLGHYLGLTLQT